MSRPQPRPRQRPTRPRWRGRALPIDTRAEHWHDALASRVQVLVDQHVGEAHIKLNPPELGSVDIKISLVDDKTFVQLTAGNSAARDELTQSLPRLRELLSSNGLSFGGASVHGGSTGQSGQESAPRVVVPKYSPFAVADDDAREPVRAAARARRAHRPVRLSRRRRTVTAPSKRQFSGAPVAPSPSLTRCSG